MIVLVRRLVALLLVSVSVHAQPPKYVIGKVLDTETGLPVTNASIINKRSQFVARTNHLGAFYLQVTSGDSIIFTSPTHSRTGIRWDGFTKQPIVRMKRELADVAILLNEVTVHGKLEAEMKQELEQLLKEPEARRKLSPGEIVNMAQSPVTLLYELFSKRAKADRKLGVLLQQDRRHKLADYRLSLIIGRATDLKGEDFDRFKEFCGFGDMEILQASEYELTFAVFQRYKVFPTEK